ncbi:Uncharacterized protein FWK35_00035355, partial [Aphis craccivora]
MSLKDKLQEIAHYIETEYPELNFENVSVSDSCVSNICMIIFKKDNDRNLKKKSLVNAIKRKISSLRKCIETMNCDDVANKSEINSRRVIKCIEKCNYTANDFINYNYKTLNEICRHIKVTTNNANRLEVYRESKKYLNLPSCLHWDNKDITDSNSCCFNESSGNDNATFHPRDVYKELFQLSLLFLGDETSNDFNILTPGPLHRFKLTARELSVLRVFNIFVTQVYIKYWYTSSCRELAPNNDLNHLKELDSYNKSNKLISDAETKSFSRHLWYTNEKLIGLAFFDNKKKKGADFPLRRITTVALTKVQTVQLCDFVSKNTLKLFTTLDIQQDFLNHHPSTWGSNKNFVDGLKRVQNLKVVNDAAERGI